MRLSVEFRQQPSVGSQRVRTDTDRSFRRKAPIVRFHAAELAPPDAMDRVAPYAPSSDAPSSSPPRASALLAAATQKLMPRPLTANAASSKWGLAAAQATAVSRAANGAAILSIEDVDLRACAARLMAAK